MAGGLTRRDHCRALKQQLREWRPLMARFAPVCRIFSCAFRPTERAVTDDQYKLDMTLTINIAHLVESVRELQLFMRVENQRGARCSAWRHTGG